MTDQSLARTLNAFEGKKVFVTGHTGFKGSWLAEWLLGLGAEVTGAALPPETNTSLFDSLNLKSRINHNILDIRDQKELTECLIGTEPDFVFHLAAQPLVRLSYREPVETYGTNVMGTVHLLEALRKLEAKNEKIKRTCAAVIVTTDKCYHNREWLHGYREEDPMGGADPYSSSKAAAELATKAYRQSYFSPSQEGRPILTGLASARAGNVIGGGDWAEDRIIPDCINSLRIGEKVMVRNPNSTRPWQHVLEPLSGYLSLAANLSSALDAQDRRRLDTLCSAFNFGPSIASNKSVRDLVEEVLKHWPGEWVNCSDQHAPHEAGLLNLTWEKAFHLLGWHPQWNFETTVERTVNWYRNALEDEDASGALTRADIDEYMPRMEAKSDAI